MGLLAKLLLIVRVNRRNKNDSLTPLSEYPIAHEKRQDAAAAQR
jgi:hypothetical protein